MARSTTTTKPERDVQIAEVPKDWSLPESVRVIFRDGTEEFTQPVHVMTDLGAKSIDGKAPFVFVGWDPARTSWSPKISRDLLAKFTHEDAEVVGLLVDGDEYRNGVTVQGDENSTARQTAKAVLPSGLAITVTVARQLDRSGSVGGSVRQAKAPRTRAVSTTPAPAITSSWE